MPPKLEFKIISPKDKINPSVINQSLAPTFTRQSVSGNSDSPTSLEPFRSLAATSIPLGNKSSIFSMEQESFLFLSLDALYFTPNDDIKKKPKARFVLRAATRHIEDGKGDLQTQAPDTIFTFEGLDLEIKESVSLSAEEKSREVNFKVRARMVGYPMTVTESRQENNKSLFRVFLTLDMPLGLEKQNLFYFLIELVSGPDGLSKIKVVEKRKERFDVLEQIDETMSQKQMDSLNRVSITKSIATPLTIKPCAKSEESDERYFAVMANDKMASLIFSYSQN